jgi:hypothetical protein
MKVYLRRFSFLSILLSALFVFQLPIFAQSTSASSEKIVEKTMSSVVLVLTGKGDGLLDKFGSGIIVRNDGVILTAYHVVKDATQVQIRLKNGEIYDKVDLLGFDERRDVAAIKISATDLPTAEIRNEEAKTGGKVFVISNPQSLNWTIADGLLSSLRLADEIPNAGRGFRVLQFSAPVSAGSSGGLLTDENGQAIGLIVASFSSGQNLNFAIPISSVKGLADTSQKTMSFGNGSALELPQAIRPPTSIDLLNAKPKQLLHNAKIFYISSESQLISVKMMENALMKKPEFEKWELVIIKEYKNADIIISVEHQLFTFDYRYTMTDRQTNIVLATGKVTVWDGKLASAKFAKMIIAKLKELREPKNSNENQTEAVKKN